MQILDLTDLNETGNIIVPFLNESTTDSTKISLIAYYVYNINSGNETFINFKHNDCAPSNIKPIFKQSFIYKSKKLGFDNNYDLELYYWWITEVEFAIEPIPAIEFYKRTFKKIDYRYIPMTVLIEYARSIKNKSIGIIKDVTFNDEYFLEFQDRCWSIFNKLSTAEITLDPTHVKSKILGNPVIKSNYKLFTSTGRPSNTNKGINLAALNKSDGTRNMIIPLDKTSILIEFDYSAFHVRLISKLIKYQLPEENPHNYFGKQYFGVEELNSDQYELSKALSFKVVYGGIDDEYAIIPFFKKVYEFRTKLFKEYKTNGFIRSVIFNRPIGLGKNLPEHKLFNYLLQSYETEFNSLIINNIFNYLYNKQSNLILYTYDSFLFNLSKFDGPETIEKLKSIIFNDGFTGSIKIGKHYGEMTHYGKI